MLQSPSMTGQYRYQLRFRRASDGLHIPGGPVPPAYLQPPRSQAVFAAQRQGVIGPDPEEAHIEEEPIFAPGDDSQISGINFVVHHGQKPFAQEFGLTELFDAPAEAQLAELLKFGSFQSDDKVVFSVFAEPLQCEPEQSASDVKVSVRRNALPLCEGRMEDWLGKAKPQGTIEDRDYPLFIPKNLFKKARDYCFKTGRQEGGALLLGSLFRQTDPVPEIFGVVDAVIELRHAEQNTFSFDPTPATFADMNAQLKLRRTRLGRTHEVPLVLMHNHPFEPSVRDDGEANCKQCPLQETCQLTSSFYSTSDLQFHVSMYGRQPWVCGMVVGLTPRQEEDIRLFSLDGSRARERGFYMTAEESE